MNLLDKFNTRGNVVYLDSNGDPIWHRIVVDFSILAATISTTIALSVKYFA